MIKCGCCQGYHETVADVRSCYGVELVPRERSLPADSTAEPSGAAPERSAVPLTVMDVPKATAKQINFLNKLLEERPAYRDVENLWPDNIEKLTKKEASRLIGEVLKVAPETEGAAQEVVLDCQDCYLALPSRSGDNDLDFIAISTWNERRIIKRILGGHSPIRMRRSEQAEYAAIVAKMTPEELHEAQCRFGTELGRCGLCGRTLTDEVSRSIGLGPICRK